MRGGTHALIGAVTSMAVALHFGVPANGALVPIIAAAVVGSLAPDIDHPASTISRRLGLLALPFRLFKHRGLTHSLIAVVGLTLLLDRLHVSFLPAAAFLAGYGSHLWADAVTRSGIQLLYPAHWKFRAVPAALAISTGGVMESLIAAAALLSLLWLFQQLS